MKTNGISLFDGAKQVVVASNSGGKWKLPAMSGEDLTDLPVSFPEADDSDYYVEFEPADVVEGVLSIDNTYSVTGIMFYTDVSKSACVQVSLGVSVGNGSTTIDFSDVDQSDYQYGGRVVYTRGVVYLYSEDTVHHVSGASGELDLNAALAYTLVYSSLAGDVSLFKANVRGLQADKMLKVVVDNSGSSGHSARVEGALVPYQKFFVCYMNLNGSVVQMGRAVEID